MSSTTNSGSTKDASQGNSADVEDKKGFYEDTLLIVIIIVSAVLIIISIIVLVIYLYKIRRHE